MTLTPEPVVVPMSVRLAFAHAALQVIADEVRADVLHIKGVAADPEIQAYAGPGSDADILVRPAHVAAFLAALHGRGWTLYSDFEPGSPFGHAATYVHDDWGYGDVHRFFPGIGSPPDEAFERLWDDRTTRNLAGIHCTVPSPAAQLTILVLNAARAGGAVDRVAAVRACWGQSSASRRADVQTLVGALRAEVAFAAGIGDLERYRDRRDYRLWKVSSAGGTRVEEWLARVYAAPTVGAALRVALRAPLVNTEHLELRIGHPPSRAEVVREFFARPSRGLVQEAGRLRARRERRHTPGS